MLDSCAKAKQKYCYWLIVLCFHCLLPMTLLCGVESAHLNRNALLGRLVRFSRKHDVRVETLVLCVWKRVHIMVSSRSRCFVASSAKPTHSKSPLANYDYLAAIIYDFKQWTRTK